MADTAPDSSPKRPRALQFILDNLLILLLITSMALGIIVGLCLRLRPEPYSSNEIHYINFPGEMLLNMLKMTIIPLIMSSLITALTSMDMGVT